MTSKPPSHTHTNIYKYIIIIIIHFNRNERKTYYYQRRKATDLLNHKKYLCIIIDGMDQAKLLVPNLHHCAKSYYSAWRLLMHLTGVINHGREVIGLFDMFQWPHDSNLTMNVLLRVLLRCDYIPDVLYLQMGKWFRENKNQFVFVFVGDLVKLEIFRNVLLCTYSDICRMRLS